ncbi:MAG: Uma2 family endonuclease [Leptolyngbyaceae cyanobacterium SM1_1_3]|nr:Uma2 family endonuclease [Leptolyngbyaceae cyanobacterium SM1_1_3]NJN02400.1 Uma2 family endonuclease [Leptolyngbyaceae cyanobacterium RM1_1_2]
MVMTAQQLADLMPDATQLDSNEPEMESSLHYTQLALLVACLEWLWHDRADFFIGANLTIYFSREQLKSRDFRGPDFFLVKQTQKRPRRSWVVWEEGGQYPDLIIELLSPATAQADRTLKKSLYQDRFRTPEYFWFSPDTLELAGYRLMGQRYGEIAPSQEGWLWSEVLNLFVGVQGGVLRYFQPSGELVPTPAEAAMVAQAEAQQAQVEVQQAQTEVQQAQAEAQQAADRAARLTEQLRALGIEPEG